MVQFRENKLCCCRKNVNLNMCMIDLCRLDKRCRLLAVCHTSAKGMC